KLLLPKPKGNDSYDVEYYWIDKPLRSKVRGELKPVRVFVYYDVAARGYALWAINVTPGNKWYDSLLNLLNQPAAFFAEKEIKVVPIKAEDRYAIKHKKREIPLPPWPDRPTSQLFAEAIGISNIVKTADHPLYADFVSGEEL